MDWATSGGNPSPKNPKNARFIQVEGASATVTPTPKALGKTILKSYLSERH